MTTIEAMKQAIEYLAHSGAFSRSSATKVLREAIAAEEARGVEPVAAVLNGHYQQRKDMEEGVVYELFTRPSPPPAGELAALAGRLRGLADAARLRGPDFTPCLNCDDVDGIADMLAADAQCTRCKVTADDDNEHIQRAYKAESELAKAERDSLTISGYQLREALEFLAPDGTEEQLEQEVCIQHGPERTHDEGMDPAGLYCWLEECPEEGAISLTGELQPAQQMAVPQGLDEDTLRDMAGSAFEEAMAFGISIDSFERLARSLNKRALAAAPTLPQAERLLMTPEQISDTYQKATGQHLRPCDKHAVETLTREIEAHHKIGVKQ